MENSGIIKHIVAQESADRSANMDREWQKEIQQSVTPAIEEAAEKQVNPYYDIQDQPVNPRYRPTKLYEVQPGGETYDKTLSNFRVDPEDTYSHVNRYEVPATYNRFVDMYNRRQDMEREYNEIMDHQDPAIREISYNKFLFDNFGYDILESKGHNVTSASYWYKKFLNHDFSNPMHNDYIMESALFEAEMMFHEYTQYKYRNGFDLDITRSRIENLYGQTINEDTFEDIRAFLNEEMYPEELDYDQYMTMVKAGIASPHDQALYNDRGEMFGFIGNDGKLYDVMTEEEYAKAGQPKGVMVIQADGDLVLDDVSGVRQVVGSFGQGLVRSVYDVGMFFGMLGAGVGDLIGFAMTGEKEWSNVMAVYQGMEGWANQFSWGGRQLRYNMDGSTGLDDWNTWVGVARFTGQIGGTIGIAIATGGAGLVTKAGTMIGLGGKAGARGTIKAGGHTAKAVTKRKAQTLIQANVDRGAKQIATSSAGVLATKGKAVTMREGAEATIRRSVQNGMASTIRSTQKSFGLRGIRSKARNELIDQTTNQIYTALSVHLKNGTLTTKTASEIAERIARDNLSAGVAQRLSREILTEGARNATAQLTKEQVAQIARARTAKELNTVMGQVLKNFHGSVGTAYNIGNTTSLNAINAAVFAKKDASEEVIRQTIRDTIVNRMSAHASTTFNSTVAAATTREMAEAFGRRGVVDSIREGATTAIRGAARVGGRMHGVYMGNPFGNLPAETIKQMLWKRGAFATTYALRDGLTTYSMLRTLDVDHAEAQKRAAITFSINTAVAFAFTGGIDDSPIRDWGKVFGRPMYKAIPNGWAQGSVGKAAFGRLVVGDVLLDTVDNYVTMGTDAYFKNPDAEMSVDGWLSHLGDFWRDPQMLMSVMTISALGARGSRRAHRMGFELPARGFDAVMQRYQNEAANVNRTPQERNAAANVARDMQTQYKKFLKQIETRRKSDGSFKEIDPDATGTEAIDVRMQQAEISGEAMIRTMEFMHSKLANSDDSSLVKSIMVEQADQEKIRLLKNTYNETKKLMDHYATENVGIARDIARHGFTSTIFNRLRTKFSDQTSRDINMQRANKFIQQVLQIDERYSGTPEQDRLITQQMKAMYEDINELDAVKNLTDAEQKILDDTVKIYSLEDAPDDIKQQMNNHKEVSYPSGDYIIVAFDKNSAHLRQSVYKSSLASYRILSDLYGKMAENSSPIMLRLDEGENPHTFAIRLEYADTETAPGAYTMSFKSALALEKARDIALSLEAISKGDVNEVRSGIYNIIRLTVEPNQPTRMPKVPDPAVVLRAVDQLITDGYLDVDRAVHVLRSVHADAGAFGEPNHYLVKYLRLVDLSEQLAALPKSRSYNRKRNFYQGEINRLASEIKQQSADRFFEAGLTRAVNRMAGDESTERSLRRDSQIDDAYEILEQVRASDLTPEEQRSVINYVYTRMDAFDESVNRVVESSKNPSHLIKSLRVKGFITDETEADMLGRLRDPEHRGRLDKEVKQAIQTEAYIKEGTRVELDFLEYAVTRKGSKTFELEAEVFELSSRFNTLGEDGDFNALRSDIQNLQSRILSLETDALAKLQESMVGDKINAIKNKYVSISKNTLRDEFGFLGFELKNLTDRSIDPDTRIKLLRDYYFNKYKTDTMADLDTELNLLGVDGVVERLNLPTRLQTSRGIVDQLRQDGLLQDKTLMDIHKVYEEGIKEIDDYQSKNVKTKSNNSSRIVIDLNRLLPNKLQRIVATIDKYNQVHLLDTVRRSARDSSIGIVQALRSYGIEGDIGARLVAEFDAYQRLLRYQSKLDSSPFLVFESMSSTEFGGVRDILNNLGYAETDYMVDGEVILPGIYTFDKDVAVVEGRMKPNRVSFGVKQEVEDSTVWFNDRLDMDTMGSRYFDEDTVINPRNLAAIGRNFSVTDRTRAVSTNVRTASQGFKLQKLGGKGAKEFLYHNPQTGFRFDYDADQMKLATLDAVIKNLDEESTVMTVLSSSYDTSRQVEETGIWRRQEVTVGVEGAQEKYQVLWDFNSERAREYMGDVIKRGDTLDPSIIIPLDNTKEDIKSPQIFHNDDMRSVLSRALESDGDTITDKLVNSDTKSLQEVLHNLVHFHDPTGSHKADNFEMFYQSFDTSDINLGGEVEYRRGMTLGEIVNRYQGAAEGSAERNLYNFAQAALTLSKEAYDGFHTMDINTQKLLSIPDVRAEFEANQHLSNADLIVKLNEAVEAYNIRNSLGDEDPVASFNAGRLVSEDNISPVKFEGGEAGEIVGRSIDRTYMDPSRPHQRALTSEYVNELRPTYEGLQVTTKDINALRELHASLKEEGGQRLTVEESPLSKIYGMIKAIDQEGQGIESDDNQFLKASIPLRLVEEMTDAEWNAAKNSKIFDDNTTRILEEKRDIFNKWTRDQTPTDPEGAITTRPPVGDKNLPGFEIRNQSLGSGKMLLEQAMTKNMLKEHQKYIRTNKDQGMVKLRKLLDDLDSRNEYQEATYKWIGEEILHRGDNPSAYMAIDENNRFYAIQRATKIASMVSTMKKDLGLSSIDGLVETAYNMYFSTTGFKYSSQLDQFFVLNSTNGRVVDTAKYNTSNADQHAALMKMVIAQEINADSVIYRVDKDSMLSTGLPVIRAIKAYEDKGGHMVKTEGFKRLENAAHRHFYNFMLNHRLETDTSDPEAVSNAFRRYTNKGGQPLKEHEMHALRLGIANYLFESQGTLRSYQDLIRSQVAEHIGTGDWGRMNKLSNALVRIGFGDIKDLDISKQEFDTETQAILAGVVREVQTARENEAYMDMIMKPSKVQRLTDIVVHGVDMDKLSDSVKLEYLNIKERVGNLNEFRINNRVGFDNKLNTFLENQSNRKGLDMTAKNYRRTLRNLNEDIFTYARLLAAGEGESLKRGDNIQQRKEIAARIEKTIEHAHFKALDIDTEALKSSVLEKIYLDYIQQSNSAAVVRFFADPNLRFKDVHAWLKPESIAELDFLKGKTIKDLAKEGTIRTSIDIETIPDPINPNKQHPFSVGITRYTVEWDSAQNKYVTKFLPDTDQRLFVSNPQLRGLLSDADVKEFISEQSGRSPGWEDSFRQWESMETKLTTKEELAGILNEAAELTTTNGKKFDIPQLKDFLGDLYSKAVTDDNHADTLNDFTGLMQLMSKAPNMKLEDMIKTDKQLQDAYKAQFGELPKSHMELDDARTTALLYTQMLNRGLTIQEEKSRMAKPLLEVEDDFQTEYSQAELGRIDEDLGGFRFDDDTGEIHSVDGADLLGKVLSVLNDYKRNTSTQKQLKMFRSDVKDNIPTFYSRSIRTKLAETQALPYFKLLHLVGNKINKPSVNTFSVAKPSADISLGMNIRQGMILDADGTIKSEINGIITKMNDGEIQITGLRDGVDINKTHAFFEEIMRPALFEYYDKFEQLHIGEQGALKESGIAQSDTKRLGFNKWMDLLLRDDVLGDPEFYDIYNKHASTASNKTGTEKILPDMRLNFEDYNTLSENDINVTAIKNQYSEAFEAGKRDFEDYRTMAMENFARTFVPLDKLTNSLGLETSRAFNNLKSPVNKNIHADKIPAEKQYHVSKNILQRAILDFDKDARFTTIRRGVKVGEYNYNLLTTSTKTNMDAYSRIVNELDGTPGVVHDGPKVGDIIMTRAGVERMYGQTKADQIAENGKMAYVSHVRHPSDKGDSLSVFRLIMSDAGSRSEDRVSVVMNPTAIKMINGDFDGDHGVTLGDNGKSYPKLMQAINKSQFAKAERLDRFLSDTFNRSNMRNSVQEISNEVSKLNRALISMRPEDSSPLRALFDIAEDKTYFRDLAQKIYGQDIEDIKQFDLAKELDYITRHANDYDIDKIVDSLVGENKTRDTELYRANAESLVSTLWVLKVGDLRSVFGYSGKAEFIAPRLDDPSTIQMYRDLRTSQQTMLTMIGSSLDSMTGVDQMRAIEKLPANHVLRRPLAEMSQRGIQIDDSMELDFASGFDASRSRSFKNSVIQELQASIDAQLAEVLGASSDVKMNRIVLKSNADSKGAEVIREAKQVFELIDMARRLDTTENEAFSALLREVDNDGLLTEVFTANDLREAVRDSHKELFAMREEELYSSKNRSEYQKYIERDIVTDLLKEFEDRGNKYKNSAISFDKEIASKKVRIFFQGAWDLRDNSMVLSENMFKNLNFHEVRDVRVKSLDPDVQVGKLVREGKPISLDGRVTAPITGRLVAYEDGVAYIHHTSKVGKDMKVGTPHTTIDKATVAGVHPFRVKSGNVDAIMHVSNIENLKKFHPEFLQQFVARQVAAEKVEVEYQTAEGSLKTISDPKGLVYEMDLVLLESFMHSKNKNDNFSPSQFGGMQEGGKIDFLTMLSNLTSQTNPILFGNRMTQSTGADLMFKSGITPFKEYLNKTNPAYIDRNMIRDTNAARLQIALSLLSKEQQDRVLGGISLKDAIRQIDSSKSMALLTEVRGLENKIKKEANIKDLSELIDDKVTEDMGRDVDFVRRLLSNDLSKMMWTQVPTQIKDAGDMYSKNQTPEGTEVNMSEGRVIDTPSEDAGIRNNTRDLSGSFLSWHDLYSYLYSDSNNRFRQYLPGRNEIDSYAVRGWIGMGEGYNAGLEGRFNAYNADERLPVEYNADPKVRQIKRLMTSGGPGQGLKTGVEAFHPIAMQRAPGRNYAPTVEKHFADTQHINAQEITDLGNPIPKGSVADSTKLRYITSALAKSIEENHRMIDGQKKYKLPLGALDTNFNKRAQQDFTSKGVNMYTQYQVDESGIHFGVKQQPYTVRPDDVSELSKQSRGAITMRSLDDQAEVKGQPTEIDLIYQEVLNKPGFSGITERINQADLTKVFNKFNDYGKEAMRITEVDPSEFLREFNKVQSEFRQLFATTNDDGEGLATISPTETTSGKHKTMSPDFAEGFNLKESLKRDMLLLSASGLNENTEIGARAGRAINKLGTVQNRISSQLSLDLVSLNKLLKTSYNKTGFFNYIRNMHVLTLINDTKKPHPELLQRIGSELGLSDPKEILVAMEAQVETFSNLNGHITKKWNEIAGRVYEAATDIYDTPLEARYALMYPVKMKDLSRTTKQGMFVSSVTTMFNPKKYSMLQDGLGQKVLINDPIEALTGVIQDISKMGAIKEFATNIREEGLVDNMRIVELASEYMKTYMEPKDGVYSKQAKKAVLALMEDPHASKYLNDYREGILRGIEKMDEKQRGATIMSRVNDVFKGAKEDSLVQLKQTLGDHDPKVRELMSDPVSYIDLMKIYESTDSALIQNRVMDIVNIMKLEQEIIGFGFQQLKQDAPTFSSYLKNMIPDTAITDKYLRLIDYDPENGLRMKPLTEGDISYVKDLLSYRSGDRTDFEMQLLSRSLNGEVFAGNRDLATHMDKFFFKSKIPGQVHKSVRTAGLFFNKFVMGNPLRLPERVFGRFVMFDVAMLSIQNPKTLFNLPRALKEVGQHYQTKGKVMSDNLADYYHHKGVSPESSRSRDYVGRTQRVKSVPGKVGEVQDFVLQTTEYMSDVTRYASFLANKKDFDAGKGSYGPAYKKRSMIDSLETSGEKAWEVTKQSLPTVGDLPLLSRKVAPYMVFTSFGWGLTRTAIDYVSSARRVIEDAVMRGDTSGVYRNLMVPGMGMAGIYLTSSVLLSAIGALFGVDDDEVDKWKDEHYFIDPYGTLVAGTPVTRSSWNPIQMLQNDWIRPLKEGYKGYDKYSDEDDGMHYAMLGLLNQQVLSKMNPLIKTPIEAVTKHDLFGSLPIPTKDQYSMWDNVRRKVIGTVLGTSAGNSLINNLNMYNYGDAPWVEKYINSMAMAIGDEFGNSRAYKQNVKDFYKARGLIYNYIYAEDPETEDNLAEDLTNSNIAEQYSESDYDSGAATRIARTVRRAMDTGQDMSLIHQIIYKELEKGTPLSSVRTAINRNSIHRLIGRIDDLEQFKNTLTDTDWKVIQAAMAFEDANFPDMADLLPYRSNQYRRSFGWNIPYNQHSYSPYRQRVPMVRMPYRPNKYKHWEDEIQPEMGVSSPTYEKPGIDPGLGVPKEGWGN